MRDLKQEWKYKEKRKMDNKEAQEHQKNILF